MSKQINSDRYDEVLPKSNRKQQEWATYLNYYMNSDWILSG